MEKTQKHKDIILLAEFVGGKKFIDAFGKEYYKFSDIVDVKNWDVLNFHVYTDKLTFHKDWNWIHYTIKKLNEKIHHIADLNYFDAYIMELSHLLVGGDIDTVFNFLVNEINKI